jgi:serine/threonine protein kinase
MLIMNMQIAQLVGTYVLKHRLYLLLYPIAEGTLQEYIMRPTEYPDQAWKKELKQCFGCLANSVAFPHSKQIAIKHKDIKHKDIKHKDIKHKDIKHKDIKHKDIKHKDIKPTNILMSRRTPILTDFGISNSFKDQEHSTIYKANPTLRCSRSHKPHKTQHFPGRFFSGLGIPRHVLGASGEDPQAQRL